MLLQFLSLLLVVQQACSQSASSIELNVQSQINEEDSSSTFRQGKLLLQNGGSNSDATPIPHGAPTLYSIFAAPNNGDVPIQKAAPLEYIPDSDNNDFGAIPRSLFPTQEDPNQRNANAPQGPPRHLWLSASAWVIITWALLAFALISMIILMTILYKKRIIQGRRGGAGGQVVPSQFIVHVQGSHQPQEQNRNPELAGIELEGEEVYTYSQEKTEQAIQAQKTNKNLIAKVDIKPLKPNKGDQSQDSTRELPNISENDEISFNSKTKQDPQEGSSENKQNDTLQQENNSTLQNTTQNQATNEDKTISNELQQLTQIEGLDMRHQCLICFEDYRNGEKVKRLKCQHTFHKECVSQWFLNSNTCPFCRVDRYNN